MPRRIHRVTMFKIADPAEQQKALEAYKEMAATQQKDGKPYILSLNAGVVTAGEERAQGYTIVSKTEFASLADMQFYDEGCAAHEALKGRVKALTLAGPPLTVWFEGEPLVDG